MNISNGRVIYRKLTAFCSEVSCAEAASTSGSRAVINIIITIIMLKAIIRYLNFKANTPFGIIEERLCYVNNDRTLLLPEKENAKI